MKLEDLRGFKVEKIDEKVIQELKDRARLSRGDILRMTTLSASGHPGGSMSLIDVYTLLYTCLNINPRNEKEDGRDRVVVSCGHTSPGIYSALARAGFFSREDVLAGFRTAGTIFDGHVDRNVPGIEWGTGNLGQGLSVGCGFALASRLNKKNYQVLVVMGDGEQQKGQIGEARRFAVKYALNNLTTIIDRNHLQISGATEKVMPQNIEDEFKADGWEVVTINGHNFQEIYSALKKASQPKPKPLAIISQSVMGKGVSFMENKAEYHGKPLTEEEFAQAIKELGQENDLEKYKGLQRTGDGKGSPLRRPADETGNGKRPIEYPAEERIIIEPGTPRTYGKEEKTDNRSAFGNALFDLAKTNQAVAGHSTLAVFDCDLAESVKTGKILQNYPDNFLQAGIQEHHTAAMAGALSTCGVLTFFADFGVFGVDETYNQHRLNDINRGQLKLVCTHNGLDVGQDGKTHQCIDYIGNFNNLFGFKVIVPADPNQTDRVIRYIASQPGNFLVVMGRSKLPTLLNEKDEPFFAGDYQFNYGKAEVVHGGKDATIISYGGMIWRAIKAAEMIKERTGYYVRVVNMSCPKEIDLKILQDAVQTGLIVTYEDHNVNTGLGSIMANVLVEKGIRVKLVKMGVSHYGESGDPEEVFKEQGLDINSLAETVLREMERR